MDFKNREMYSKIGKSTNPKIAPLLKAITQKPKVFRRIIVPFKRLTSKEEIAKELEMLKRKIIYHSNKVSRTVTMKEINSLTLLPKSKGTSSFLTFSRPELKSIGVNSPDSSKYTPHYTALYANPKCVIPWEKTVSRRELFAPQYFSFTRKNSAKGKACSALPTAFTSVNNTILLPRMLMNRSASIQIFSNGNLVAF